MTKIAGIFACYLQCVVALLFLVCRRQFSNFPCVFFWPACKGNGRRLFFKMAVVVMCIFICCVNSFTWRKVPHRARYLPQWTRDGIPRLWPGAKKPQLKRPRNCIGCFGRWRALSRLELLNVHYGEHVLSFVYTVTPRAHTAGGRGKIKFTPCGGRLQVLAP